MHVTNVRKGTADASNGSARPHKATHQLDTAQQAESCRENCKRVRASGPIPPEVSVAALTLNESDQQKPRQKESAVNLRLVKLLLSRGKPRDALVVLDTIITADISNADALCLRGQCYMAEHDNIQVFCCMLSPVCSGHYCVNFESAHFAGICQLCCSLDGKSLAFGSPSGIRSCPKGLWSVAGCSEVS